MKHRECDSFMIKWENVRGISGVRIPEAGVYFDVAT